MWVQDLKSGVQIFLFIVTTKIGTLEYSKLEMSVGDTESNSLPNNATQNNGHRSRKPKKHKKHKTKEKKSKHHRQYEDEEEEGGEFAPNGVGYEFGEQQVKQENKGEMYSDVEQKVLTPGDLAFDSSKVIAKSNKLIKLEKDESRSVDMETDAMVGCF